MRIDDFYVCADTLPEGVSPQAVDALAEEHGIRLPDDYAAWVTTLGQGMWCGGLMVYTPDLLTGPRAQLAEYRSLMDEFWFWDEEVITQEDARRAVPIADSDAGDWFVIHPDDATICWLPRDDDTARRVGTTIAELRDWFATSGLPAEPTRMRWFEPDVPSVSENWTFAPGRADAVVDVIRSSGLVEGADVSPDLSTFRFTLPSASGTAYGYGSGGAVPGYLSVRTAADTAVDGASPLASALEGAGARLDARWDR